MVRTRIALAFSTASALGAVACDSATVYEDCASEEKAGTGEVRCLPSKFSKETARAREAVGFVTSDGERVPNAIVRIGEFATTTDAAGFYRIPWAPFRYDATARLERDVVTYRDAAVRFLDLTVEREIPRPAWTARVALVVPNAPRPGHALAFFASGDILGMSGELEDGFVVSSRRFEWNATIHAIEYPEAIGPAGAIAKGSVDVRLRADGRSTGEIALEPVTESRFTTFTASPPPGFVAEDVELTLDFGTRLSETVARRVPLGTPIALPLMPGGNWTARVRAARDGAVASSGRRPFPPGEEIALTLFPPPEALSPAADAVAEGGMLSARGAGVFEHVLVPLEGDGRTLHVLTTALDAAVPDLTGVALPRATGRYVWTVRSFPDFAVVEALSGIDTRLYRAVGASSPRTIVLP